MEDPALEPYALQTGRAPRVPSEEKIERTYRVGLDDVLSELGIHASPKLKRTVEVVGSELVVKYAGTVR